MFLDLFRVSTEFNFTIATIIFFADLLFWFLQVFLINNVRERHSAKSGTFSALLNFTSYIAVFFFVKNIEYLAPACLGAFVGAMMAVEYDKRFHKKEINS